LSSLLAALAAAAGHYKEEEEEDFALVVALPGGGAVVRLGPGVPGRLPWWRCQMLGSSPCSCWSGCSQRWSWPGLSHLQGHRTHTHHIIQEVTDCYSSAYFRLRLWRAAMHWSKSGNHCPPRLPALEEQ